MLCFLPVCVHLLLSSALTPSQEVFNDASSGDKEAMAKVEAALNEKLFPGINTNALKVKIHTWGGRVRYPLNMLVEYRRGLRHELKKTDC